MQTTITVTGIQPGPELTLTEVPHLQGVILIGLQLHTGTIHSIEQILRPEVLIHIEVHHQEVALHSTMLLPGIVLLLIEVLQVAVLPLQEVVVVALAAPLLPEALQVEEYHPEDKDC